MSEETRITFGPERAWEEAQRLCDRYRELGYEKIAVNDEKKEFLPVLDVERVNRRVERGDTDPITWLDVSSESTVEKLQQLLLQGYNNGVILGKPGELAAEEVSRWKT